MSDTTTEPLDLGAASDDDLKAMGLPAKFTLEQLKGFMTEEEIEAELASDDPLIEAPDPAEKKAKPAPLPGDDPDEEDEEDDEDGDGDGDDEDEDDEGEGPGAAAKPDDKPEPVYQPKDVSEQQAVVEAFKDERRKLREAYDDGDLTDSEFEEKLEALTDQVAEAKAAIKQAEVENAKSLQEYQAGWYERTGAIMDATPQYKDTAPVAALNGYSVAQVFNEACIHVTSNPAFAHLSLTEKAAQADVIARAYYRQQTGQDLPGGKAGKAGKAAPNPRDKVQQQGPRPKPVQTLGTVTAASETGLDDGRFATVDKSVGLDAEREYSRMSPAEREAYLAGA